MKFTNARKKYGIDYEQKPVPAYKLRYEIEGIIEKMQEWEKFQKELNEAIELQELYQSANADLEDKLASKQDELERTKAMLESNVSAELPLNMRLLIQSIFPDVEFKGSAFQRLTKGSCNGDDWNRMFKLLKLIDWKNEEGILAEGFSSEKYKQGREMGYKNLWEYHFSYRGRIFVEKRNNEKPLIVLLDPKHKYSDMARF